jgi:hypothetical protein
VNALCRRGVQQYHLGVGVANEPRVYSHGLERAARTHRAPHRRHRLHRYERVPTLLRDVKSNTRSRTDVACLRVGGGAAGPRTITLKFSMDCTSFPIDNLFVLAGGIKAALRLSIREDDRMLLPVAGLPATRKVYMHESAVLNLDYSLPKVPTGLVTLHVVQV